MYYHSKFDYGRSRNCGDLREEYLCHENDEECFLWKLIGNVLEIIEDYLLIHISFWLTGIRMHLLDNTE
jgi:hypothetical protein